GATSRSQRMSTDQDDRTAAVDRGRARLRPTEPLLMLRQILHGAVLDPRGERLGRVVDCVCRFSDTGYPRIKGLVIEIGGRDLFVPMAMVTELGPGSAKLEGQTLNLGRFERREGEVLLAEDVLGRRMIDVAKGRLIVAENLALAHVGDAWRLAAVAPGRPGLLQGLFNRGGSAEPRGPLVDWADIEPFVGHVPTARLLMPLQTLKRLHPAQIADLVEHASHEEGEEILEAVQPDAELTADVFEELDPEHQREFLRDRSDQEAAAVLDDMELDDAADLLTDLPQERRAGVIAALPPDRQAKLRRLLQYNPEVAGGMMSLDVITVPASANATAAIERVRTASDDVPPALLGDIFVIAQDGTLLGSIGASDLLRAGAGQTAGELPGLVKARVRADADLSDVALLMSDYNLTAAPVVDEQDHLVGAISVDDVVELLIPDDWRRRQESEA
ncbi:MAG: magnesium transporter, partial [Candidatus Dormibacteraeota bacterium]|nr:magnesium transporter [Candidatus Dormibacteraeota bacterium]